MPVPLASICIAAYNEEARIGHVLQQLLGSHSPCIGEVIVCANGCQDGTEAVVAAIAQKAPKLSLVTSPLGKTCAWNTLVAVARNDYLVFVDADLSLTPGAVDSLVKRLHRRPDALCVSGIHRAPRVRRDLRRGLAHLASRPFVFDYLYGGLYAVRRRALLARIEELGFDPPAMPSELVAEDIWLEFVLGRERFEVDMQAVAEADPGTLSDVIRARVRREVALDQIAQSWPELCASTREPWAKRLRRKAAVKGGLYQKLLGLSGTALRKALLVVRHREVLRLREAMTLDVATGRAGVVLATSGRLSNKGP
jgi:glycosyltransferase involved in cell wall biosynthesis